MKVLLLLTVAATSAAGAGLVHTGIVPCPCEMVHSLWAKESASTAATPAGLYVEARDATVWGGACHVSAQADTGGSHAAMGWAFDAGVVDGVELSGVKVIAALQGSGNLGADEIFRAGERAERRAVVWIDAPTDEAAKAAFSAVQELGDLRFVQGFERASLRVSRKGDDFVMTVPGVLEVGGEALADRSCCTMPESRWYEPLADSTMSVVGVPTTCRVEGEAAGLRSWTFEDENSAYVARFGS